MSLRWVAAFAVSSLIWAGAASAQDRDGRRLISLEDRITALEDQLRASQELIRAQQEVLKEQALPAVGQGDASGLDPFLRSVQIGGHISTSYIYNFANPEINSGPNLLCQFNCNHNEFSLDAAKLEIGREATESGSVGFQFDLLYGQNANIFGSLAVADDGDSTPGGMGSDQELFLQQAYVTYNMNGVEFKMGKFETLLGYELIDSDANANVTQGVLFTYAIPLYHMGLMASGNLTEELGWHAGIVNGFNNTRDVGDNKGFLGLVSWESGPIFTSVSSYIGTLSETRVRLGNGATIGDNSTITKIFDAIIQYKPTESTTLWVNADWGHTQTRGVNNDPQWFGAAVGWKQQLMPNLYFALRGEVFMDDDGSRLGGLVPPGAGTDEINVWTGTVTLGYNLTPNLLARLEYRQDLVECHKADCDFFFNSRGQRAKDRNDLGVVEVVYSFD